MFAVIVLAHVYTFIWIGWLALFLILEASALYIGAKMHQQGGTLSEFV